MRLSFFLFVVAVTLFTGLAAAEDTAPIKNVAADSTRILSNVEDEERVVSLSSLKKLFGSKWEAFMKKLRTPSESYKKAVEKKMLRNENNFIRF
ncbi:putative RxLR effector [Phytophthora cinnamomi]|uniref:putative RxLR effector n=1 Tax=Phytophthora cinnamomi TaxID=4785 RepID=UPI002A2CD1BB|nr:putative RxLR effector [Phytophthora cinnamomi]KAJ8524916.1 hypothetical protein ON010_g16200 [Phytophthora cinnamomi]